MNKLAEKKKSLSLAELSNALEEFKSVAGEKISYLYELFVDTGNFPFDASVDQDGPGLWPSRGVQTYSITKEMNISEDFCSEGILAHFAVDGRSFQVMYVINDLIDSDKNGKMYFRASLIDGNSWTEWQLVNMSTNTFQSLTYKGYSRRKSKIVEPDVDPKRNYTEIALSIGSYYSTDLKRELINNVRTIEGVLDDLRSKTSAFTGNLLTVKEGDVLVFTDNSYIAIYDGAGGCYGSSIPVSEVVHYDNCLDVDGMLPISVIKV